MDPMHNTPLVNWDQQIFFSEMNCISLLYMLQFDETLAQRVMADVFVDEHRAASNPSVLPAAVITFPHFTSLVINGLCQSNGVIGCTSSPVKRLISTLLCG